MIKYFIGWILIFFSLAVPIVFFTHNLEFSWYFSESYKIYDLIYSLFSFIAFISGLRMISKKSNLTSIILIAIIFVVYQILGWQVDTQRFISSLQLDQDFYLVLKPYDGGAFTTTNFKSLVLLEKKYLFLITENKTLKSYDDVFSAELKLDSSGSINIELVTYSKKRITESVNTEGLF